MPDRFSITHTYSGTTTDWTSYFTGNIVADNLIEVDYPSTPYRFEPILSFEYTPLSDLEYGKHTLEYTIKDARGHTSTQSYHFWIDDFQVTHTNHSLNLQTILPNTEEDSDIQTIITVQTYGAGFDILSQGTLLSSGMDTIHNWRDSDYTGYGYNILYNEGV
ncbi:MAG: hypothetical protein U9Q15_04965 [Patescibacteria group bacterium]|nr:hypothetical protein [Patescibacteria group bacterium]